MLLVRPVSLAVLLVTAAAPLAACTGDPEVSRPAEESMDALEALAAPEGPWQPAGAVGGRLPPADAVPYERVGLATWAGQDVEGVERYAAVWAAPVDAATGDRRCAEAVAWLEPVSAALPGEVVDDAEADPAEEVAGRCRAAVDRLAPGTAGSNAFGGGAARRDDDTDYETYLVLEMDGASGRLVAVALASPAP